MGVKKYKRRSVIDKGMEKLEKWRSNIDKYGWKTEKCGVGK